MTQLIKRAIIIKLNYLEQIVLPFVVKTACSLDRGLRIVEINLIRFFKEVVTVPLLQNEEATGVILLCFNIFPFLLLFFSVFSALNPAQVLFMTSTCTEMICGYAWFDLPVGCLLFLLEDVQILHTTRGNWPLLIKKIIIGKHGTYQKPQKYDLTSLSILSCLKFDSARRDKFSCTSVRHTRIRVTVEPWWL